MKKNKIRVHKAELWEITKAWLAISLAFTVLLSLENRLGIKLSVLSVSFYLSIALFTAGISFLFHELAHKLVAQRFKCEAEFKADNFMLLLAVLLSFIGVIFAAPGAVYIKGFISRAQQGLIALAGPLMNLILALSFLPGIFIFDKNTFVGLFFTYGFAINSWLGLFNMIPVGPFDGAKVYRWNKKIFYTVALLLLGLVLLWTFVF